MSTHAYKYLPIISYYCMNSVVFLDVFCNDIDRFYILLTWDPFLRMNSNKVPSGLNYQLV